MGPTQSAGPAPGPEHGGGEMRMSATVGIGRIPVRDVHPVVENGRRPAKAVTGETFEVTATVFREGHDAEAPNVVLK
ncbi:maltotransferase domain-containing protein, partial [Streptomyces coelicoflavus]|uniref:maltotransferase domain-containing protein n=1 Tax=Streptomyces coelicoflavus TaxID=285562 RepID=UPI0036A6875F